MKMTGEKFLPPKHGWGNRIYHAVTSDEDTTTKGINIKWHFDVYNSWYANETI